MVLVLDDLAEIVEELVEMLGLADIPATGAHTLDEAVTCLIREPTIGIVIGDVRLARESGLDIIHWARRSPALAGRTFHYVFITGDPLRIEQAGEGFDALVLEKPVQPRALIQHIEALLGDGDSKR